MKLSYMKRILTSLLVGSLFLQSIGLAQAEFEDTAETYADTIQYLEEKGVIEGYGNSEFKPEQMITEAEFIKMMLANYEFDPNAITLLNHPYKDVSAEDWFAPYVQKAWEMGITPDGTKLTPNDPITRAQATRYMLNLLGIPIPRVINENEWPLTYKDVPYNIWYAPTVLYGESYGLIGPLYPEETDYFRPLKRLTRGEATQLIFNIDILMFGSELTSDFSDLETELFGGELEYEIPHLDIFINLWNSIHTDYYWSEEVDDEALIYNALAGMMEGLEDPYSVFFDPPDTEEFTNFLQGEISGIGAYIVDTDDGVTIQGFISGGSAESSGLTISDIIVDVDGVDVRESTSIEVANLIRGETGTDVVVTIDRDGELLIFTLTRHIVDVGYVGGEVMGDVLYIDINLFDSLSFIDFTHKTNELVAENPDFKGFIIDLRDNPGGYLNAVHSITGHFLRPNSTMFFIRTGPEETTMYSSEGEGEYSDYPIVFLVNESTASAAEIMAIALKEKNDAVIVGDITFGKGTVQQITYYADGSSVKMTIAEWLSPKFHSINEIGITPHYPVERTLEDILNGEDPQLEKALEVIANEIEKREAEAAEEAETETE